MSDWQLRLSPTIDFVSPEGNTFSAKWRGNQREIEKMLGKYSFPGRDGSILQDLGTRAVTYPLTFFFDGPDHDLFASAFFECIKEHGAWTIEHPSLGFMILQPVKVTEISNPVESGNVTEIQSEWIEPLNQVTLETARQMYGVIDQLQKDLNAATSEMFADEGDA